MSLESNISESHLAIWRNEQYKVASQVIVLPNNDPININAQSTFADNPRYKIFPSSLELSNSHREKLYGGVDVSFPREDDGQNQAVATYVINRGSETVYRSHEFFMLSVPYVSSYLSFREIDPLERLVKRQISEKPELTPKAILVDGNGIMHVRRAGIASFLGVRTGIPTIGVAKTLYCHDGISIALVDFGIEKRVREIQKVLNTMRERKDSEKVPSLIFDRVSICTDEDNPKLQDCNSEPKPTMKEMIQDISADCGGFAMCIEGISETTWGAALVGHGGGMASRKKKATGTKNPIFISVGHKLSLHEAVLICAELSFARIPEPVRKADLYGRELIRNFKGKMSPKDYQG